MTFDRITIGVGAVAALAIAAILAFMPWSPGAATLAGPAAPHPILQPITPSTWPYSQLAVLRQQRMSDDILPPSYTKQAEMIDPDSARRLGRTGDASLWIGVDGAGETCVVTISNDGSGSGSFCSSRTSAKAGDVVASGGNGDSSVSVYSDGPVDATKLHRDGYRQVAPNTWLKGAKSFAPSRAASTFADRFAYPVPAPYSRFAILRRTGTTADVAPAEWTSDGIFSKFDLSTLRYAGSSRGAKVWVVVDQAGEACLIVSNEVIATACATSDPQKRGQQAAAVGSQGTFGALVTDGTVAKGEFGTGDEEIAPGVWVGAEGN